MTNTVDRPIERVAVIGIGSMGNPMARHIRNNGFALTVCDTGEAALAPFAELGVPTVRTPAACAGCDVVLILVATPEQLRSVTTGADGLRHIAPEEMPRYIVVASTVAPGDMHELAAAFAGLPTRIVDAPISGGVVGAQRGTLTFLAGGADTDIAALGSLFRAMGPSIFHCGPLGAGQATKAINNVIAIANLMVSAEAYAIAHGNGLALDRLIPALDAGSGRNFLSRAAGDPPAVYAAWSGTESAFDGVLAINRKDIDLALALGGDSLRLPAITALRRLLDDVGEETLNNWRNIARMATD